MNRKTLISVLVLAVLLAFVVLQNVGAQRRYYGQRNAGTQSIARRIDALERRVLVLESQLGRQPAVEVPQGSPVSVEEAHRLADAAQQRLAYSQVVFRKGYISEAELESLRFASERAKKLVQLAEAERDGKPTDAIQREITVHDAALSLALARRQLRLAENIAARGFASASGVEVHEQAVADAEEHLRNLKADTEEE